MLDRLGSFVFVVYFLLIGIATFAIVSAFGLAASVTGQHVKVIGPRHISRAETIIRRADRSAQHRAEKADLLIPMIAKLPAGALAEKLDEAEAGFSLDQQPEISHRPRVAGWVGRPDSSHQERLPIIAERTHEIGLRSFFAQNGSP